jgi:hypothetical protein
MRATYPLAPVPTGGDARVVATPLGTAQPMISSRPPLTTFVARGMLAGLGGAGVMTVFQKLVEMPITGREDSYAPQKFAEKVLPIQATTDAGRKRLNYATHFALGMTWGAAYGVAAYKGLRGPRAIAATFATIYVQDVLMVTALGLDKPWTWSRQDTAVDVIDKFVNVVGTGLVFDNVLAPAGARGRVLGR